MLEETIDGALKIPAVAGVRPKGKMVAKGKAKGKAKQAVAAVPKKTKAPKGPTAAVREAAFLLKQVSDPTRLTILLALSDGPQNVTGLCRSIGVSSQPAASHHLALLRAARLVAGDRDGKFISYSLTEDGRRLADAVRPLVR